MKWHHIMDKQPENGETIIQCNPPFLGNYLLGIREYVQATSFENLINYNEKVGWPNPDFYWMSSKDFTFPNEKDQLHDL